jgi:hypothetical protein
MKIKLGLVKVLNAESNVAIATQTGDKNISEQNNRMIIILLLLCK